MRILEPVVRAVGQLSFRNKLRATAVVFGIPLLIAAGVLLFALNARVSELERERDALAVQVPALALAASLHQYQAASLAAREGADGLGELVAAKRAAAGLALAELQSAFAGRRLLADDASGGQGDERLLGNWPAVSRQIAEADADDIDKLATAMRSEFDKLNEDTGLLIDGEASSSRLLDIMTTHLPGLVDTTGRAAQIGSVVLVKKSLRGSRRTDLTLQRGNFDALVQWSMDGLQKVSRDHPELATNLGEASSRLNAAYLAIQEAMTVKMLDTTDFDMAPEAFIALTAKAFDETLAIGSVLVDDADALLADRLALLEFQRNAVVLAIVLVLALVVTCFVAAYISIMRGLNGLADAVTTMAAGDLSARVEVSSSDELGAVGAQFNLMVESLAQRTAELREKTNDIHSMLQNMEQGILTIVDGGRIHPEYSAYLETIFATNEVAGQSAMSFLFGAADVGADALAQVEATIAACIGEDRMNFDFNAHLLVGDVRMLTADGQTKFLHFSWSPICDDGGMVEKIMVCVRDVSELRQLEAEAEHQKRELEMIGQILKVNQEKFHAFIDGARTFIVDNEALLNAADGASATLVDRLFRNMHTIKGNARTYGLLHLTNLVHEAEQAYEALRRDDAVFDRQALLDQLQQVQDSVEEYASLNDVKLGRKGPGRRGSAEKYVMVQRTDVERMVAELGAIDLRAARPETLVALIEQVKLDLRLIGTETVHNVLDGVFESLPSLARELGKAPPNLEVRDHGIHLRNQVTDLLRNVFMHLYRNALDHGIETPAERVAGGKPAAGTIRLELTQTRTQVGAQAGNVLQMRLHDDGRGLALAHIRRKAIEKGLATADAPLADEAVAQLIFAAGFSTAAAVTEVSGRGVGMDAVLNFLKREGGSIDLVLTDDRVGADYRSFATVISLPEKFAVCAAADVVQRPAASAASVASAGSHGEAAGEHVGLIERVLALPGKLAAAT